MNICKNCAFWDYCLQFRYKNIQESYMEEVRRKPSKDGALTIIYVEKCKRYIHARPYQGRFLGEKYK